MDKIVFLNGDYLKENEAKVSIFDRGYLFGDGVYEVVPVIEYTLIDKEAFIQRLSNSLLELSLSWPLEKNDFLYMIENLIKKNALKEGGVYIQITRGVAPRDFSYPANTKTTCTAFTFQKNLLNSSHANDGVKVAIVDDIRWKRRDIKSIALLGQCMAKDEATKKGAYEGWMHEDGFITEGTSSSAYIIKDGIIITRPLSNSILPGIRRKFLLEYAKENKIKVIQRAFSIEEALNADEAFLSSATTFVYPVIQIDNKKISDGKPGPLTKKLRAIYIEIALKTAGVS